LIAAVLVVGHVIDDSLLLGVKVVGKMQRCKRFVMAGLRRGYMRGRRRVWVKGQW
jgi:hypothetical protein